MSWLDDYAKTASQYVDAPTLFQKAAAYWTLGSAIGRRVYYQFGMSTLYPNLFMVLVGRSGAIKKSTTKDFALNVLDKALPEIDLPGRGSPEAFRDALEEKQWYGVLHYDEFNEFLSKRRREYSADMDTTIMELFAFGRKSPIRTKLSGEIRIPAEAIISFIAPTTMEYMVSGLTRDDLMSGKIARFMFVEADQDIEYPVPPPMPQTVHPYLGNMLKQLIPNVAQAVPMHETPEAKKTLEEIYYAIKKRVEEIKKPEFQSAFSRAQVYGIKLAMIHALSEGRMTIEARDYTETVWMIQNWRECLESLSERVGVEDRFHDLVLRAERYLRDHPSCAQRDLQRHLHLRHNELKDVLRYLQDLEMVEIGTDSGHNGKSRTVINLIQTGRT